jgi:hypothetical protein
MPIRKDTKKRERERERKRGKAGKLLKNKGG